MSVMDAEGTILYALKNALAKLGVNVSDVQLAHPEDLAHGDYATSVALAGASMAKKNPKALAEEIVGAMGEVDGVAKIEVAGPGFINFTLARGFFPESVKEILSAGEKWGSNDHVKGYKVIVEYSQPNPFKPFHIGHLMSTTVGESISRFVEFSGANIFRANYQGDIGLHIAKAMWGLQKEKLDASSVEDLGKAYVTGAGAYEDDAKVKEEIHALNKRLYANDPELKSIYDTGRATSLAHFDDLYKVLGSHFDHFFFESEIASRGVELVKEGLKKGIFEESDGAIVYKGEKVGLHTRVFITSQKTPTYEAKEVALAEAKQKVFSFDLNITTIAVEQDNYFKVVEAALGELLPEFAKKYTHVAFGMMQLASGKMSSRKGNIITGESLLADMRAKAMAKMEERDLGEEKQAIADAVAVAAIKYGILKQARGKNIIFDPEASLSFEGDSGPYLQYSHVRACAVLRKAKEEKITASTNAVPEESVELERLLYRFPEVVFRSAKESEPHYVTTFLTELAASFNGWYAQGKIVDSADQYSPYNVAITQAFATTMKNGLWLLGIQAPERM